ncbi:hypothetical protein SAMN02745121_07322, partial [Nannocystis exedens]
MSRLSTATCPRGHIIVHRGARLAALADHAHRDDRRLEPRAAISSLSI